MLKLEVNMKKYLTLILLSFSFFLQHCESNSEFYSNSYSKSTINTMDNYQFPTGTYYKYNFSSLNETIDCENEIERLKEESVVVKQAWYRNPLNGCSPPGSGWTTNTMYGAVFLVLLENPNDSISDIKYSNLTYAPNISCGYKVTTYKLK